MIAEGSAWWSSAQGIAFKIEITRYISILEQLIPSPRYPLLHEQLKLPSVLVQLPLTGSQSLLVAKRHSLISIYYKKKYIYNNIAVTLITIKSYYNTFTEKTIASISRVTSACKISNSILTASIDATNY